MLFWLFVILLVIGIVCAIIGNSLCECWLEGVGFVCAAFATIAIVVSLGIMIDFYGNVEAKIAENNKKYESLVYQLENNLYDNDNDFGKKELYNQIREWNEDLAYYQNTQDNFWFGIYYPNVFDQFEFIELK